MVESASLPDVSMIHVSCDAEDYRTRIQVQALLPEDDDDEVKDKG